MRKRPTEGGRSTQDSNTDGAVVPNMWLVQLDNGVLYVPVIDWLSDPVPVADWLRWRRSPTEVSSSGQEEDSKSRSWPGRRDISGQNIKYCPTVCRCFCSIIFYNNEEEFPKIMGCGYRVQWLNRSQTQWQWNFFGVAFKNMISRPELHVSFQGNVRQILIVSTFDTREIDFCVQVCDQFLVHATL